MATPKSDLLILAPRRPGDGFAPALVLHHVDIAATLGLPPPTTSPEQQSSNTILALKTGYITQHPHDLVHSLRKQIVVAVTAAGWVVAFDHNLKLLWKQSLVNHMPLQGRLDEAAILITEHAANKGDKGLVVVGVQAEPDTLADDIDEDDILSEEIIAEGLERAHVMGRDHASKLLEVGGEGGTGRHFSYFAFAGDNGQVRWKHEALDFHRDLVSLQEATVSTQHSMHAAAQLQEGVHYGEASCRDYREAVLASLPHAWSHRRDTRLELAHFHRHRDHKGAQREHLANNRNRGGEGSSSSPQNLASRLTSSKSPTTKQLLMQQQKQTRRYPNKHYAPPNVVVAHMEEGIEAIHIFSGRTVCRLFLDPYALHVDLNGDGIPDHVHVVGGDASKIAVEAAEEDADEGGAHARVRYCAATVTSGIPPKQSLFNGTVCSAMRFGMRRGGGGRFGYIEVATPVALPMPGKAGHYRQQVLRQKKDAVFLTSRGDLTAYTCDGEMRWQATTGAFWAPTTFLSRSALDDVENEVEDVDPTLREEEEEMEEPEPTLVSMALRAHAIPSVILAAGDDEATIVSEHGNELVSFELPERPSQPLVVIDFNLDGYNDIVMMGHTGVYGWAQVRRPGAVPFSALVGVLIVIMLTVFVMQQGFMQQKLPVPPPQQREQVYQQQGGGGGVISRTGFKGRSTDRID